MTAAGLAVFLAVASSWASACDLSCSLQRIGAGCGDRAAANAPHCGHTAPVQASAANEMPGMPDMPGMTVSSGDAKRMTLASRAMAGSQPCSRNSLSASAAAETSRYEFQPVPLATMAARISGPSALAKIATMRHSPPPRITAERPLSSTLRI